MLFVVNFQFCGCGKTIYQGVEGGLNLILPCFNCIKGLGELPGDMASDLYGPQFWDDNFQFSFSVVVSCKSNKQLGYF